ncbi:MAG: NUDIX domain-containing protein [Bacillota bacterium]|nr:NUDIX domain-containing protein [Bacillota bacterium]
MKEDTKQTAEQAFLEAYRADEFERPSVSVDVVAFTVRDDEAENYRKNAEKKLEVLLMKRTDFPFKDRWALPGGFIGIDEDMEEAAQRVLKSKTDLSKAYLEQLYTWGAVDRDPRHRIFSISYLTLLREANLKEQSRNKNYEWFALNMKTLREEWEESEKGYRLTRIEEIRLESEKESFTVQIKWNRTLQNGVIEQVCEILENESLAFDHAKIIAYALRRLREKIEYSPLAFSLMPERFTLTQLQQVYERILGRELLKANFRRKIAPMVIETDDYKKDSGHRPSRLYRFNTRFTE